VESGRLEAFSDGVFAVAITLLALNLAIGGPGPHQPTLAAKLADHWPAVAAYAVSFAAVGIIWVNHHALFRNISEIDRTLLFVNLLLLFFVVSIPFATATIAAYLRAGTGDASLAAALYLGVLEGMSICFTLMFWWAIRHDHLKAALSARDARQATIRFGLGSLIYIAGIGIAFVSAPASLRWSGSSLFITSSSRRRSARRPRASRAAPVPRLVLARSGPDPTITAARAKVRAARRLPWLGVRPGERAAGRADRRRRPRRPPPSIRSAGRAANSSLARRSCSPGPASSSVTAGGSRPATPSGGSSPPVPRSRQAPASRTGHPPNSTRPQPARLPGLAPNQQLCAADPDAPRLKRRGADSAIRIAHVLDKR